jgi:biopolymer transport protein TolR
MNQHDKIRVRRGVQKRLASRDEDGATGELPIVPLLDVITNITLFLLATMSFVLATSEVSARTPESCAHCSGRIAPGLNLSVSVTHDAVRVAGSGGVLAPGCDEMASAGTRTITRDGHEWEQLTQCLTRIHAAYPEEREVILSADAQVPYEDVIAAMDAARADGTAPLFPEVRLSAGVR